MTTASGVLLPLATDVAAATGGGGGGTVTTPSDQQSASAAVAKYFGPCRGGGSG